MEEHLIVVKKKFSVKEFIELVGHHSEGNIRFFRLKLRENGVIKSYQPLTEDMIPIWNEVCKVKEAGATWKEAMNHVIGSHTGSAEAENPQPNINVLTTNNDQKIDEIILLLKDIKDILKK